MQKILKLVLVTLLFLTNTFTPSASAADIANGGQIFSVHCAGCHVNGSNIIRRGKNLQKKH